MAPAATGKIHAGTSSRSATAYAAANTRSAATEFICLSVSSKRDHHSSGTSTTPAISSTHRIPPASHCAFSLPRTSAWPPARQSTSHTVLAHAAATTSER